MGHYANWQDAFQHLNPEVYGSADVEVLEAYVNEAEDWFDNELRLRFAVPFDSTENPEAFALAAKVVALRAAAAYVEYKKQDAITEGTIWFVKSLRAQAKEWMERLKSPLVPTDAPGAASPYTLMPKDGGGVARDTEAGFKNANIMSGSTHW